MSTASAVAPARRPGTTALLRSRCLIPSHTSAQASGVLRNRRLAPPAPAEDRSERKRHADDERRRVSRHEHPLARPVAAHPARQADPDARAPLGGCGLEPGGELPVVVVVAARDGVREDLRGSGRGAVAACQRAGLGRAPRDSLRRPERSAQRAARCRPACPGGGAASACGTRSRCRGPTRRCSGRAPATREVTEEVWRAARMRIGDAARTV